MIEIVGIFVAAGDCQHARAQNIGNRAGNQQRIARIRDQSSAFLRNPDAPFGGASSITPPSEVMRPPSNAAVIFLCAMAGKLNTSPAWSDMAGVALPDSVERTASTPNP